MVNCMEQFIVRIFKKRMSDQLILKICKLCGHRLRKDFGGEASIFRRFMLFCHLLKVLINRKCTAVICYNFVAISIRRFLTLAILLLIFLILAIFPILIGFERILAI